MNIYPITIHTSDPASVSYALRVSGIKVAVNAIDHIVANVEAANQSKAYHRLLFILGAF